MCKFWKKHTDEHNKKAPLTHCSETISVTMYYHVSKFSYVLSLNFPGIAEIDGVKGRVIRKSENQTFLYIISLLLWKPTPALEGISKRAW